MRTASAAGWRRTTSSKDRKRSPSGASRSGPGTDPDTRSDPMLDEASARLIAALAASGLPPLHELTPEQARVAGVELAARPVECPEMLRVEDIELDGPRVRVLVPCEPVRGAIVYYHGGGWVTGGIDQYDALARRLADRTGCAVVLVGYRLAPEHRYPTAVEDAWTALRWTADEVAAALPIIVAGDSAGGGLATVMAQRTRHAGGAHSPPPGRRD